MLFVCEGSHAVEPGSQREVGRDALPPWPLIKNMSHPQASNATNANPLTDGSDEDRGKPKAGSCWQNLAPGQSVNLLGTVGIGSLVSCSRLVHWVAPQHRSLTYCTVRIPKLSLASASA